jgi:hypothetical protein
MGNEFFLKQILEMARVRKGYSILDVDCCWESLEKLKNLINNMVQKRIETQPCCHCNTRTTSCDCQNRSTSISSCSCNTRTSGCDCQGRIMICPSHSNIEYINSSISLKELKDKIKTLRGITLQDYSYIGCSCQNRIGDLCICQSRTDSICVCNSRTGVNTSTCVCDYYSCVCRSRESGTSNEMCYEYGPRFKDWPRNRGNSDEYDGSWKVNRQTDIYSICRCKGRSSHEDQCHCHFRTGKCQSVTNCSSETIGYDQSVFCQCNSYLVPVEYPCICHFRTTSCDCQSRSSCTKNLELPIDGSRYCGGVQSINSCTSRFNSACTSFISTGISIGGQDNLQSSNTTGYSMENSYTCPSADGSCVSRVGVPTCECNLRTLIISCECHSRIEIPSDICSSRCGCDVVTTYNTIIND